MLTLGIPGHDPKRFEIYAERSWQHNSIDVRIGVRGVESRLLWVAQPIVFSAQSENAPVPQPALRLDATDAQMLMDQLWLCGLRPSEGTGSAGALAATQRHLDDLRKITFALMREEGLSP